MEEVFDADVVIVGAGPVGVTLALHLVRAGISVIVLERSREVSESPRAMVYLHPLLPDLDAIGMLAPMKERGVIDHDGMNLHLPALGEVIRIPNTALQGAVEHPYNLHLGQGDFTRIALGLLAVEPLADVRFDTEVTAVEQDDDGARVLITSADRPVRARWVVGADGSQSVVRRSIGATLDGTTWGERFVATNVRADLRAHGFRGSNMYVHPEIGCVVAAITPDGLWRCTYQESLELPEETVSERIPAFFDRLLGDGAGAEVVVDSFSPYRMHQRQASSLREGRVVLAGDAAHITNPTGGLGLTTGLYDVLLLQETLIAILTEGADPDLLDAYAADRARIFTEISSPNASRFKQLVYDTEDPAILTRMTEVLREASATEDRQRAFLLGLDGIRSAGIRELA